MAFEWDEIKSQANLAKHGIDFHTASLAFADPFALTMRDELHGDQESRFIMLAAIDSRTILFAVFTVRAQDVIRIISARGQLGEKGQFMKKLNKKQKKQIAAIAAKKDADIDLTDMPEVLDWSKAEIGKFYRPGKKPVTIRLDTDIIALLKSYCRGYQPNTNMLLRHAMKRSVHPKTEKLEK